MNFSKLIVGTMRLGQWGAKFSSKEYEKFIDQCIDLDLVDFDHADIYGNYTTEEEFGAVLKSRKDLRQKIRLTSKCGIKLKTSQRPNHKVKSYDLSAEHIRNSVNQSLKNLGTDYLDLLLLHRPDYLFDPHEIAEVVDELKKQGQIHHFGISNFSRSQVSLLSRYTHIDNHQFEFSLKHTEPMENGLLDQCINKEIRASAWSPLGSDIFFSADENPIRERVLLVAKDLQEKYNCTLDQLLLAFILKHPAKIVPVMGTTKVLRLATAMESIQINLSREDWYILFQARTGMEVA